jgi:tripartite-type tricarboxylate transporter receptor subunit TctC
MSLTRRFIHACFAFGFLAGSGIGALAQPYPQRPVTIVVPYAAGGTTDILARMLGQGLKDSLGQSFIVENKPGAGTVIGAQSVARAEPDGHTLLMATSTTLAINASLYKSLPYDPVGDFAPISLVAAIPLVIIVHPSVPASSVPELIQLLKTKPGGFSYASAGVGSPHHLAAEMFKSMTGVDVKHVPYRGSAPALSDVVGGHVPLMFVDMAPALPMIADGRVRALAVTSGKRAAAAPALPTVAEAGLPGYEAAAWQSIVAPARTPPAVVAALHREISKFLSAPETRQKLVAMGTEPLGGTPDEFAALIKAEIGKWAKVVKESGATAD